MRIKFTITLLVLNIVLLFALWGLNRVQAERALAVSKGLLHIQASDIDRIEIKGRQGNKVHVLERKEMGWHITEPINWPANVYAVQRILTHLEFLDDATGFLLEDIEKQGQTLSDYGLDNPQVILKVTKSSGEQVSLSMGDVSPIEKKVYILSSEGRYIYLVSNMLFESLLIDLEDMRSQNIFSIPQYEVKSVSIKVDSINLAIILNKENDLWWLKAPIQTRASLKQVNSVLNELSSVRVNRFLKKDELENMASDLIVPAMRVSLTGNNRRQTLKLGALLNSDSELPEMIAQFEESPSVFVVDARPFLALREAQNRFRERHFLDLKPDSLTAIEVGREGKIIELQLLETGNWQVHDLGKQEKLNVKTADHDIVLNLIEELNGLYAIRFASDAPSGAELDAFGFDAPQRIVKLYGDENIELLVGGMNRDSGLIYAKLNNEPFVYEISSRVLTLLQTSALHYQDRSLEAIPAAAKVNKISLSAAQMESPLVEIAFDDTASLDAALAKLEQSKADAIRFFVENCKHFTVERFLNNEFNDDFVFLDNETPVAWVYQLEIDYDLPGSDGGIKRKRIYSFTDRLGGNFQIGKLSDEKNVFRIKQEFIDALFSFGFEKEHSIVSEPQSLGLHAQDS